MGVGVCDQSDHIEPLAAVLKELCIQWVLGYQKSDFAQTLEAILSGELQPAAMITDVVTLAQLPAAFEALRDPVDQCKVLVDCLAATNALQGALRNVCGGRLGLAN